MKNDIIERGAVRPAITQTLNAIMQDIRYGNPVEPKDEKLRRYGEMIGKAIEQIPSAGTNELTVSLDDIGVVCGALTKAGYVVVADRSGRITYEREVSA